MSDLQLELDAREQNVAGDRRTAKHRNGRIWDLAIAGAVGGTVIGMVVGSFVGVTGHDPTGGLGGAFDGLLLGIVGCIVAGFSSRNADE